MGSATGSLTPMSDLTALVTPLVVRAAEEGEVSHLLSYGIGALTFAILISLLLGLLAFGKGREHS